MRRFRYRINSTNPLVFPVSAWLTRASKNGGKMKKLLLAGVMAMVAATTASAAEFREGDWVLAQYNGGAYWFPGVVESARGGKVSIAYDDGERETRPAHDVKMYNWGIGSRIECRWKNGAEWYPGRITGDRQNGSISVAYDDGDKERTTTDRCRSR